MTRACDQLLKLDCGVKNMPHPDSPFSHDVEYSVLSRDWDGEYLDIIGSLPKKLYAVPEYSSPSGEKIQQQRLIGNRGSDNSADNRWCSS